MQDIHLSNINAFIISGGVISLSFSTVAAVMIQRGRTLQELQTTTLSYCTLSNDVTSTGNANTPANPSDSHTCINAPPVAPTDHAAAGYNECGIITNRRRLSTPYRRLIFGLCASDILQSTAFILGPFLVPRGSVLSSPWGLGTVSTCNVDGVLIIFGSAVSCMYTCSMCIYYFCKTVKDMSDHDFYEKIEKKLHWFILFFNIPLSVAAVCTKSINPVVHLGFCHFSRTPNGCNPSIPGDCDRGRYASIFALLYCPLGVPVLCLLITILCTVKVVQCYSSSGIEKTPLQMSSNTANVENVNVSNIDMDDNDQGLNEYGRSALSMFERMSRLLRREAIGQLLLHMLVFLFVYGVHIIGTILRTYLPSNSSISELNSVGRLPKGFLAAIYIMSIIRPLGGFFNVLICVRPQFLLFRRMHPNQSWIQLICLFFKKDEEQAVDKRRFKSSICSSPAAREICCCCIWSKKDDGMDISPVLRQIVEMQMSGEKQYVSRPTYPLETTDEERDPAMDPELRHQSRTMQHHFAHVNENECIDGSCTLRHSFGDMNPAFSIEKNETIAKAFARALDRAKGLKDKYFNKENASALHQNDFVAKAFAKAFERVNNIAPPTEGEIMRYAQRDSELSSDDRDSSLPWSDRDSISTSQLSSFQIDNDFPRGFVNRKENQYL